MIAPAMALLTGTRFGSYEILSLIGVGGMGEVYRAHDPHLNRDVAVKVLLNLSTDPQRLHRFEQEARAAGALNHPNILAVFHMGTYEGAPYLVSELLQGETLRQALKRGALSIRKVIDYGVQIARGLEAAHERGIVHRDLKPENLFLTRDGRIKILDFGLAKLTQPLHSSEYGSTTVTSGTDPGVVMGTVGYMSPEQVRGDSSDHRTDIFAFGAVLYEMLAGNRAFQKPTATETMTAILREDPPNILDLVPNLSPGLQRILQHCLEKGPEQRFHSAGDLAFALDSAAGSSVSGQRSVLARPVKRKTWLIPVSLSILVASVVIFWLWPQIRPQMVAVTQTPEDSSQGVAQSADAKAKGSRFANPHELTIQDAVAYTWFDPSTRQPLVWYSSTADGNFRFFDGPGVDPQTGQDLNPATPEFIGNLRRQQSRQAVAQKQKAQITASSSKGKETRVNDSAADRLREDAQLEAMAQEAQLAANAKDYRKAVDVCTKVLTASAGSQPCTAIRQHASIKLAEQFVNESTAYWEKGEFDKALRSAEEALDSDPANKNAAKLKRLALQMKPETQH
jgi:serine/threonine protein kinase